MKTQSIHTLCAILIAGISFGLSHSTSAADLESSQITAALKRSADWQLANPSGTETRDWIIAPLYDGLLRTASSTGDAKYLAAVIRFGTQAGWMPSNRVYHADDHAVGHAWLDVRDATYFEKKTPNGKKTFWSRGNGWVYGGLALMLENLPKDHPKRGFYEKLFKEMTTTILAAQQEDGLWRPSLLDPQEIPVSETSGSGFFTFGLAWGVNHGLLDRTAYLPVITRAWNGLMTRVKPDGLVGYVQPVGAAPDHLEAVSTQDYGTGASLLAGSEILRLLGAKPADTKTLLATAKKIIADDATPRAYVRLVPERKDDLAWENDKVAFRVYGPALRSGPEDSGIDVWCKRVARPVIDKWYADDLKRGISYHKDHGEGFDGYHVGDTRGCGGLGLWVDGKLVISDTYLSAEIIWTGPEVAEFHTVYQYPVKVEGKPLFEYRVTRLRLGERLCDITSTFSNHAGKRSRNPATGIKLPQEVAIGINTQDKGASMTLEGEKGLVAVYEPLAGKGLGTGVILNPSTVVRTMRLPATDKAGKNEQALIIVSPDDQGRVSYRCGFAWAADGEITTEAAWLTYLKSQKP